MTIKIESKIIGYSVESEADKKKAKEIAAQQATQKVESNIVHMHEKVERPEMLLGSTYKIKTPLSEHALYITINDMLLNPDSEHEQRIPFEMFINSKNMDHFQWIVALTRIVSAVFRKGGDITFLSEELKAVFDPTGGYFKKGGKFMPSLVAEIGEVLDSHLRMIGIIKDEVDENVQKLINEKRTEYEKAQSKISPEEASSEFPAGAQLCKKCSTKAMILMDGCMTCLNCGDSKCG